MATEQQIILIFGMIIGVLFWEGFKFAFTYGKEAFWYEEL